MENKKDIKELAKKIIEIELILSEFNDPKLLIEIEELVKDLTLSELIELDEEINQHMGMSYPQKNI